MITQNAACVPSPGKTTFIPNTLAISVSGQDHEAEDREHAEHVVVAVRDHRLVRVLERLDDLLVVVEQVPDALGGVDDVVEVELELLGKEALDVALEHAQRRALRLDDLAVRDDLLLDVRDVADDLVSVPSKISSSIAVELVRDLVEDREAVVEEVVEDLVEQAAGAACEELLAEDGRPPRSGGRAA